MPLFRLHRAPSDPRPLFAGAALLCFAAAFVLTPSDVRSQSAALPEPVTVSTAERAETPLHPIAPQRDAFEPRAAIDDAITAPPLAAMLPSPPPRIGAQPMLRTSTIRITAIVTGQRPTAIVDEGGATRTITTNDPLGGANVTAIDAAGVALSDGRRIPLVSDR